MTNIKLIKDTKDITDITDTKDKAKPKTELRIRTANIMQYEEYLSEEKIKSVVNEYAQIDQWAYVKHDKDIELNHELEKLQDKKPHFHIVLKLKSAVPITHIANWFGIQPQYIHYPKGANAFIQCCQYLTHENKLAQEQGKYLYDDSEIKSNFNFRDAVDAYVENSLTKNNGTGKLSIRKKVLLEGLKLSQIDLDDYAADWVQLQLCRREYIKSHAPMPNSKINFYITGGSGTGKSLSSRALAKTLIDPQNKLKNSDVFFTVGQGNAMFQGYDGQPVLIWDDLRAFDLLNYYNKNVGAIFNLFDVIPSDSEQNIKFSSVKLINSINIVNSIQTFQEFSNTICFKNGLSAVPEPDKQIYRRFPFFVELSNSQKYDFFVNQQFFNPDEPNYKAYLQHKNMGIGLMRIAEAYKDNEAKKLELINKHFEVVDKEHKRAVAKFDSNPEHVENLQKELELEILESETKEPEIAVRIMGEMSDKSRPSNSNNNQGGWGGSEFTPY